MQQSQRVIGESSLLRQHLSNLCITQSEYVFVRVRKHYVYVYQWVNMCNLHCNQMWVGSLQYVCTVFRQKEPAMYLFA